MYSLNVGSVLCDLISGLTLNTVFFSTDTGMKLPCCFSLSLRAAPPIPISSQYCKSCLSFRGGTLAQTYGLYAPKFWPVKKKENRICLINLPRAVALDRASIFFTSSTLCIPHSAVLWNEMATSMNLSPELMESSRKGKRSVLEMTLLIFSVSHLIGRERRGAEGESITWASTDVTPPVPARPH